MTDRTRTIKVREVPDVSRTALTASGISPVLARVLAARGIKTSDELDDSLTRLAPIETLKNCVLAGTLLADTIANNENILIV
ncbi:MAG: single-stranded-DNA-specific exonuclease RecJ, partial [Burkholderiales bacterium]|nr:single-stranded-DNA-specific exonuclease RecJ [Burkholderiales bacterium]